MSFESLVLSTITEFPALTVLIAALFFGEGTVIILGFLVALGLLSPITLITFGFIGKLIADTAWFIVGKMRIERLIERKEKKSKHLKRITESIEKITKGRDFQALFISRFFYLIRILMVLHVSKKGMKYKKFLIYEIPIILIWLSLFTLIGFALGLNAKKYFDIFEEFQLGILILIIAIVMMKILKGLLGRVLEKINNTNGKK